MARLHHHLQNAFIPHPGNDYRPHALRPHMLRMYAYAIVAVKIAVVLVVSAYSEPARQVSITPTTITQLTNQTRQAKKLSTLRTNALLTKAAEAKAADMARLQYFAHVSPTGATPWSWFKKAGYSYTYAGENLALDFVQSEDVIAAWLKSPSHRSNLLSTKYKDIGIAVRQAKINGVDSLVVVQMFGAPLPTPTTKTTTKPVQTPSPTTTKQQLTATAPEPAKPVVLGETIAPPTPPATPTIATPDTNSLVRNTKPEVIGQAEPGAEVLLSVNDQSAGRTTVPPNGIYSVSPDEEVAEGIVTFSVQAFARGLSSQPTAARTITIDAQPPTVTLADSYLLPSILTPGAYDIGVTTSQDAATVSVMYGGSVTPLTKQGDHYSGVVIPSSKVAVRGVMTVRATDLAGNEVTSVLADPDLFTAGVVAPTSGPLVEAFRLIFYSRAFLAGFLVVMLLLALLNVFIHWEHQHRATIIGSFLVIYLAGTLLLV
ncbi:MAG: hypothetical protein HY975_02035 [Candidatus Kerfeldbacteria bacterium]|nr:hypothetical protein [Candidatus Kerfeldbacteria bacterium]